MGTPAIGSLAKFAVDSALPFDTSSKAFEIQLPESLSKRSTIRRTDGLRGTRQHDKTRRRLESEAVGGTIAFHPGVAEFDWFLPYILGGATVGGVTPLAETIPSFYGMLDRVTKVFTYAGLKVNTARLSGASGSPVALSLDLEGTSETVGNAGTFPAIAIPDESQFIYPDLVLTLDGDEYEVARFELVINNVLDTNRYMNSTTRSQMPATDLQISLGLQLAFTSDEVALYDGALAGIDGSLALDNGTNSYTFAFANLHAPAESPTVQNKSEIMLPLNYVIERTTGTSALSVTKA